MPPFWRASWWRGWFSGLGGGQPMFPLVVLFGLNCVDELDRRAFEILTPEIRKAFGLNLAGVGRFVAIVFMLALIAGPLIGFYADRWRRVTMLIVGAAMWGTFSLVSGMAGSLFILGAARGLGGLGKGVVEPTQNSLLADYYDIPERPRVYSLNRAANALGLFIGPLAAGLLADAYDWRMPFFVFAVPTFVFVVLAFRLHEPDRGFFERRAMNVEGDELTTEDVPLTWAESWRAIKQVRTLQRVYSALPFFALALIGLTFLTATYYAEVFDVGVRERGFIAASVEPFQFVGILVGIPIATRFMRRDPGLILRFIAAVGLISAVMFVAFSQAPNLPMAIGFNMAVSFVTAMMVPAIFATLSLTIPPKVRGFGFGVASLYIIPGVPILWVIGALADSWGVRASLVIMAPVFFVGCLIIASGSKLVAKDMQKVWQTAAAQTEVLYERRQGNAKLLLCRGVTVHYDNVQVLFGVDFEVDEGEVVALLGTNGAGKSTLLKAITGTVEVSGGAIVFDGQDMTHTPANEAAQRGVTMVPGGQGVFPGLSVAENLRLAGWLHRHDPAHVAAATEKVLDLFPILRDRIDQAAGNLSGGQQQMLTLGMAFIEKPRLLMIDELSLGLAPTVVGQLLTIVEELRAAGTTIILVEQSVNVALTVAQTAYFMEKGEIRFHGPTAELLDRPDILRSVFLEGAAAGQAAAGAPAAEAPDAPERPLAGVVTDARDRDDGAADLTDGVTEDRLEVRSLDKRYGGVVALDDVSLTIRAGEIVGFIGPNGAGKTTLFDAISGLTPIDGGRILMRANDGEVYELTDRPAQIRAQLGLGRSFQDGRLFPSLTVAETLAVALDCSVEVKDPIAAALYLPAVADSEAKVAFRVDELIELMGLEAFRNKFISELSTGSRRIVDLACVMAHRPTVLMLDEPSSGIAQREAEALGPLIQRLRDDLGASVLVIEHDLPLLTSVSDRMIAMDLGEVVAQGDPHDVVNDPRVVSAYLGDNAAAIARSGSRT